MTERIEAQIERFAPGFRDLILAQVTTTAAASRGAQPELRRRRHRRRGGHVAPDRLPAHRAVEPVPDRDRGRLPLLGLHPTGRRGPRHVRRRGSPHGAARSRLGRPRQERSRGKRPAVNGPGARVRLVPVPGHLRAPLGRPPLGGPPDRVARRALDGCDRGGPDHRVVPARLRHQHRHSRISSSSTASTTRPSASTATTRSSSARSPTCPTSRRSSPRWGSTPGPVDKNDEPLPASEGVGANGSVDGLGFDEDRIVVTQGRLANPRARPTSSSWTRGRHASSGYHLGETVTIGWVTQHPGGQLAQLQGAAEPADQDEAGRRRRRRRRRPVPGPGLGQQQPDRVLHAGVHPQAPRMLLQRHAERDHAPGWVCRAPTSRRSKSELRAVLPKGVPFTYVQATDVLARAERTLKPESIALGVFGGIAGLAALLIAGQVIGRRIRLNTDELDVLRALGADPRMTIGDGLIGTLGAVLLGTLLAGLVAVGLSPLGPSRPDRVRSSRWRCASTGPSSASGWPSWRSPSDTLAVVVAFRAAPHRVVTRLEQGSGVERRPRRHRRRACHRPRSPGSASPSNPVRAGTRCRSARPSSAPCWRSWW